jgi:hypothetical protein
MAHTMGGSTGSVPSWEPAFRETWIELLARTGRAIADALTRVRGDVEGAQPVRSRAPDPRALPRRRRVSHS